MTLTPESPRPMQRPRGRAAKVRADVHAAVVELLADGPVDALSIPLVADRSGVHQATIYRRWGTVAGLLNDVVATGPARTAPLPDTGNLRKDIDAYALAVADSLAGPLGTIILRTAMATATAGRGKGPTPVLVERSAQLAEMLDRARDRGEAAPSVDELLEVVVAPLYFRALFGPAGDAGYARSLVDRLMSLRRT